MSWYTEEKNRVEVGVFMNRLYGGTLWSLFLSWYLFLGCVSEPGDFYMSLFRLTDISSMSCEFPYSRVCRVFIGYVLETVVIFGLTEE